MWATLLGLGFWQLPQRLLGFVLEITIVFFLELKNGVKLEITIVKHDNFYITVWITRFHLTPSMNHSFYLIV